MFEVLKIKTYLEILKKGKMYPTFKQQVYPFWRKFAETTVCMILLQMLIVQGIYLLCMIIV